MKMSYKWADVDVASRETEGPTLNGEPSVTFLVVLAEAAALALFVSMIAIWAVAGECIIHGRCS